MHDRVLAAVSGGVDSAVAAHLLKKSGRDVLAATIKLMPGQQTGIKAAEKICEHLDIQHSVIDMTAIFEKEIVGYFLTEYSRGRTPNPCVRCNRVIKFAHLCANAAGLGCSKIATGHYARIEKNPGGRFILKKGLDPAKDQSYFLYALNQEQLRIAEFPIGNITKDESRKIAGDIGILDYVTPESQEFCFALSDSHQSFVRERLGNTLQAGPVFNTSGKKLGEHEGIELYTIGQRRGLGIAGGRPLYVVDIRPEDLAVVLGEREDAMTRSFAVTDLNWIAFDAPPEEFRATVKIRYLHPGSNARISRGQGGMVVEFEEPQFALAPGQSAVFYDGDAVLGGGTILKRNPGQ